MGDDREREDMRMGALVVVSAVSFITETSSDMDEFGPSVGILPCCTRSPRQGQLYNCTGRCLRCNSVKAVHGRHNSASSVRHKARKAHVAKEQRLLARIWVLPSAATPTVEWVGVVQSV